MTFAEKVVAGVGRRGIFVYETLLASVAFTLFNNTEAHRGIFNNITKGSRSMWI